VCRIRFGCRSNPPTHGIELPHQPGIATPRIRRGYLLDPVVPPETLDATERRYPALGAYTCPGEDEDFIRGRNGEHGSSVSSSGSEPVVRGWHGVSAWSGGLLWGEHAFTNQASPHASDNDKDSAHAFRLAVFHWAAPATLACSGIFPASAGTGVSEVASFIKRQTDAREMQCFLATFRDTKTPYRFLPKKSAGGRQIGLNLTTIDLKLRKRLHLADGKGCGKPQTENPPPATKPSVSLPASLPDS
jgi:hypothetical protein